MKLSKEYRTSDSDHFLTLSRTMNILRLHPISINLYTVLEINWSCWRWDYWCNSSRSSWWLAKTCQCVIFEQVVERSYKWDYNWPTWWLRPSYCSWCSPGLPTNWNIPIFFDFWCLFWVICHTLRRAMGRVTGVKSLLFARARDAWQKDLVGSVQ